MPAAARIATAMSRATKRLRRLADAATRPDRRCAQSRAVFASTAPQDGTAGLLMLAGGSGTGARCGRSRRAGVSAALSRGRVAPGRVSAALGVAPATFGGGSKAPRPGLAGGRARCGACASAETRHGPWGWHRGLHWARGTAPLRRGVAVLPVAGMPVAGLLMAGMRPRGSGGAGTVIGRDAGCRVRADRLKGAAALRAGVGNGPGQQDGLTRAPEAACGNGSRPRGAPRYPPGQRPRPGTLSLAGARSLGCPVPLACPFP